MVKGKKIREWLFRKEIKGVDVAAGAGVSLSYVSHFLAGRRKGAVIRAWLLQQGCPAKYLGEDGKQAA